MENRHPTCCTAFEGSRRIASGELIQVATLTKQVLDRGEQAPVLIFDDETSELIEVDFRGTVDEVVKRLGELPSGPAPAPVPPETGEGAPRGPGRPKLGVVAREVTLLPRHWDWLNGQPGGASVALRKLVEEARRINEGKDRLRRAQESVYRFISAMAGNQAGFEEATRALFAGDQARFNELTKTWPVDVLEHTNKLTANAFQDAESHSVLPAAASTTI